MRRLVSLLAIASLLAAIGAVSAFAATGVSWHVGTSKTVKIHRGGVVKWTWTDGAPHNVHGAGFTSKTTSKKGFTYSHRFRRKGTFKIICQIHPTSMKTIVKVS